MDALPPTSQREVGVVRSIVLAMFVAVAWMALAIHQQALAARAGRLRR